MGQPQQVVNFQPHAGPLLSMAFGPCDCHGRVSTKCNTQIVTGGKDRNGSVSVLSKKLNLEPVLVFEFEFPEAGK